MSISTYPPIDRAVDTYDVVVAIVQALLGDPAVTDDRAANGYEGVGSRVYPDANLAEPGVGQAFPYLIVTAPANAVLYDYGAAYLNAPFDITVVDRAHTPTNQSGGTRNVVGVAAAAQARLLNHPLVVSGYSGVSVAPETAPRGTATVQDGLVYRQRQFTVRVRATLA